MAGAVVPADAAPGFEQRVHLEAETQIRCNDPDEKRGGTSEGWLWVISLPGEDVGFDWRLSRRHGELTSLIEDYGGILQSDGYGVYEAYAKEHPKVIWVACWAHARRKFFEAEAENPKAVRFVLRIISWLYEAEARWDEHALTPAQRRTNRQRYFTSPLYWLKKVVIGLRERARPKSGLGKACDYLLWCWAPLPAHLQHGETRLDNNLVENAIRPSVIGKKNWLFIGHPDAGQRSAVIYSIVVSCQRRGIEPLDYLRDVLSRLPTMTTRDNLDALTPARWKPAAKPALIITHGDQCDVALLTIETSLSSPSMPHPEAPGRPLTFKRGI